MQRALKPVKENDDENAHIDPSAPLLLKCECDTDSIMKGKIL